MLEQKIKQLIEKIKKEDKVINSFIYLNEKAIEQARSLDKKTKKGKLYGKVIAIKSNINIKGMPITCASKTLENYKGTFDATVIKKIKNEDGLIIGMTNMDEFAAGASGETSAFGPTKNPHNLNKISGGSSSGSAAAVAANFCDIALGSDTGGSIRNPASHCGVVGVKPSYGLVSRYGLIDLSMSLDQIGPIAKNISDALLLLNIIKGKDENDTQSVQSNEIKIKPLKKIKIGTIKFKGVDKKIQELIDKKIELISKKFKWKIKKVEIPYIDLAVETYYPLVYSEFFSATRRFDGRRYGKKIEDAAGKEVLRRILGGSEITKAEFESQYYEKALQVKALIKNGFEKIFKEVDAIIIPTVPTLPWNIGEGNKMSPEQMYATDALTSPANLAGICALSMPAGTINSLPIGLQIMCDQFQEEKMFSIAKKIESLE